MRMNFASPLQIRQAIYGARREVLLALPQFDVDRERAVDVTAAQSVATMDVQVQVYVPADLRGSEDMPESDLIHLARAGVEIRTMAAPVPRMTIVDQSVVVIACNKVNYADGALIGRDLPFISMIVWSLTAEISCAAKAADIGCDEIPAPLAREVLRQLTLGTKDETAAREMGLALRTYRRMVARLMDQLDARSRFQAGYLAAQRHWL